MDKKGRQQQQAGNEEVYIVVGTSTNIRWIKKLGKSKPVFKKLHSCSTIWYIYM